MKMAQKRSYVGAVLIATASSGRFTQDIEDMDLGNKQNSKPQQQSNEIIIDADGEVVEPKKEPFPDRKGAKPKGMPKTASLVCSECGEPITKAEQEYSEKFYGMVLGRCCQGKFKKKG